MRSDDELRERLDDLYVKRLREREKKYLSCCHMNCVFNQKHQVKGKGGVSFCSNIKILKSKSRPIFVCDDDETAAKCRLYDSNHTKESVKKDFEDILKSPSLCGREYPKMAILIWCLQDVKLKSRAERHRSLLERIFKNVVDLVLLKWW